MKIYNNLIKKNNQSTLKDQNNRYHHKIWAFKKKSFNNKKSNFKNQKEMAKYLFRNWKKSKKFKIRKLMNIQVKCPNLVYWI